MISSSEITRLHKFCKGIENIYGKDICTPNIHMHLHLKQCLIDFGPVYSFWCFSFERYNDILGNFQTNKKDLVITIMRKFCREAKINSLDHSDYNSFMSSISGTCQLKNPITTSTILARRSPIKLDDTTSYNFLEPNSLSTRKTLSDDDWKLLFSLCKIMYHPNMIKSMSRLVTMYKRINYLKDVYASDHYRKGQNRDKYVMVFSLGKSGNISEKARPAVIKAIYEVQLSVQGRCPFKVFFLQCDWLKYHPYQFKYGKNMQIWSTEHESLDAVSPFVPLHLLQQKFVCITYEMRFKRNTERRYEQADKVNVVIPVTCK